jgi:hypothetical protein
MWTGLLEFETLRYAAWAALILLAAATFLAVFFTRRSVRIAASVTFHSTAPEHGGALRYGFIALFALIGSVLALEISAGEPLSLRAVLVVISAAVLGVAGAWLWQTVAQEAARRAARRDWLEKRTAACAAEFVNALDPDDIRTALCHMLARELDASPVHFFALTGRGYERLFGAGAAPAQEVVFPPFALLASALEAAGSVCALRLADHATGAPLRWGRFSEHETAAEQALASSLGAQAAAGFRNGGALSGFVLLGPRKDKTAYGHEELRFASDLAARAAFAVQMAVACERKLSQRLRERSDVHRVISVRGARAALQPPETVALPLADCAAAGWTGVEGNGFCDVISLPGARLAIVSAESGPGGEEGAIELVRLQTAFRTQLRQPGADLVELVRLAVRQAGDSRMKLFAGIYDAAGRVLRYVNASHTPPVVMRLEETGISAVRLASTVPAETPLKPGELLIVFSEGLVNARNAAGEVWGERRMLDTLLAWEKQRADDLVRLTLSTALEFTGHSITQPDRTLVVLKPLEEDLAVDIAELGYGISLLK